MQKVTEDKYKNKVQTNTKSKYTQICQAKNTKYESGWAEVHSKTARDQGWRRDGSIKEEAPPTPPNTNTEEKH